ncbi:MAG: hypothetical protein IT204_26230 [Fimbriimonadaceae bacterium]|nr:hypothetical protein [Fimbriimonadaceae bacterium]
MTGPLARAGPACKADIAGRQALLRPPDCHAPQTLLQWTLGEAGQALLGEGVAVCLDHGDTPIHVRAGNLGDDLLPLADLLGDAWFDRDPAVAYTQSGSVACWLLERYGADAFRELFPRTDFEAALQEIYGFDLEYLETDWRTMLEHS